jgi:hypothetical protein
VLASGIRAKGAGQKAQTIHMLQMTNDNGATRAHTLLYSFLLFCPSLSYEDYQIYTKNVSD